MSDVVERLRRYFPPPTQKVIAVEVALLQEAADEIETLRSIVRACDPEVHPAEPDVGILDPGIQIHGRGFAATAAQVDAVERVLGDA